MIPYARFAHDWPEAGGRFYNVVDPENSVYQNGSTISIKTANRLQLPLVETVEDEIRLLDMANRFYLALNLSEDKFI